MFARPEPQVCAKEFLAFIHKPAIPDVGTISEKISGAAESDSVVRDQRWEVIKDLRYIGITAGSLFPGLDGACEGLAEQNFVI